MTLPDPSRLTAALAELAQTAGTEIMRIRARGHGVDHKADGSPVTEADRASEAIILAGLRALTPDIPAIAEESAVGRGAFDTTAPFWLIDPLDGTKSFIVPHEDDFSVNIGLIVGGRPRLGVVYGPARRELFATDGTRVWRSNDAGTTDIHVRAAPERLTLITSRRSKNGKRYEELLAHYQIGEHKMMSGALKYGVVAMGGADLYIRPGNTMEWDNAAGEAILCAAGGHVTDLDGQPLRYGQDDLTHRGFIASGRINAV